VVDGSNKTVNNVLSTLNKALKTAVEWKVIRVMPCTIRLLKVAPPEMSFYDCDEYERLVAAARAIDPRTHIAVLLGGDAGLRASEVIAVEQTDADYQRGYLNVQRAEWRGQVGLPKSGRPRRVPMTKRLSAALRAHRHLRGARMLCRDDGKTITANVLRRWLEQAERRAELEVHGAAHKLRHTLCSHLAMRGAPARAIQELAGHKDLTTTQRYMHLSPSAIEALSAFSSRARRLKRGASMETSWRRRSRRRRNSIDSGSLGGAGEGKRTPPPSPAQPCTTSKPACATAISASASSGTENS
jgi:integrase